MSMSLNLAPCWWKASSTIDAASIEMRFSGAISTLNEKSREEKKRKGKEKKRKERERGMMADGIGLMRMKIK